MSAHVTIGQREEFALDDGDMVPQVPTGFVVLRKLGSGASAVVWLARDQHLDRLVALKLIATGADRRLAQRLIREGQAAARLRHPNIVAVHTMNATERQAWLSMDLMEGGDLRQRLAHGLPSPRECAEWVRKLADALAHAHANEILHRDIKPSNVLLSANGEPHLSDFGLAAPLEGGGDLTLPGQVAGTAAYLAPELLAGADRASPSSDVYGLGAVLYECLTGRPPFVGDSTAVIFAQLVASDPPAPHLLRPDIPRDLETICLKCLEKMPARRYASALALRADLDHYLRGEPITARPVSFAEKTIRWCRRHPATAVSTGLAAVSILSLAIGGPLVALRLAHARAETAAEAASSKAVSEFLRKDLLAQAAPDNQPDRDLKLRTVLDRAAKAIDGRFNNQPMVEADLRDTLATTYLSLGEYAAAHLHWERLRELYRQHLGADDPKTLLAGTNLADTLRHQGKFTEAEKICAEVLKVQRRVLGAEHSETISSINALGLIFSKQAKWAEAETMFAEALQLRRRVSGMNHPDTGAAMNNLAGAYLNLGKDQEGTRLHLEVLDLTRRILGPDHPNTLVVTNNLANMYLKFGNLAEAEKFCDLALEGQKRVLGPDHPDTLISLTMLANIYSARGKFADAALLDRQILDTQKRKLGPDHQNVGVSMSNLATAYRNLGRLAEAEELHAQTWELNKRVLGAEHAFSLNSLGKLVGVYVDEGKLDDASRLGAVAVSTCERVLGPFQAYTIQAQRFFGTALLRQGKFNEAEAVLRRSFVGASAKMKSMWQTAFIESQLGQALLALKRYGDAEPLLLDAHAGLTKNVAVMPPADRTEIAATAAAIAQLYREWNQPEKALAWERTVAEASAGK